MPPVTSSAWQGDPADMLGDFFYKQDTSKYKEHRVYYLYYVPDIQGTVLPHKIPEEPIIWMSGHCLCRLMGAITVATVARHGHICILQVKLITSKIWQDSDSDLQRVQRLWSIHINTSLHKEHMRSVHQGLPWKDWRLALEAKKMTEGEREVTPKLCGEYYPALSHNIWLFHDLPPELTMA